EREACEGLRAAADPVAALHALGSLLDAGAPTVPRVDVLLRVLGGSPALCAILVGEGAEWPARYRTVIDAPVRTVAEHGATLEAEGARGPVARAILQRCLRVHRRRELVRIGGRDLAGLATVDDTVRELSALAEATIEVATRSARARVATEWGGDAAVPFVV